MCTHRGGAAGGCQAGECVGLDVLFCGDEVDVNEYWMILEEIVPVAVRLRYEINHLNQSDNSDRTPLLQ